MEFAKLEKFIFEKVGQSRLPGTSAAVLQGNEITWSKGFGYRDLARGLAATPRTIYSIGSVTKSFTCMAIMQLAEAGKLKVDDLVSQYLPAFDIRPAGEPVRIWHLMSHSAGIPALAYAECMIDGVTGAGENWLPVASVSDMLTFMQGAQDWTLNRPGERWFYLNEGYVLLSAIIEKCSGEDYKTYVTNHILKPLGMNRSVFEKSQVESDPDAAVPYVTTQEGERKPSTYPYGLTGDGGLISSVLDLTRVIGAYIHNGTFNGTQVLSPASIQEMETPRVTTPNRGSAFGDYRYAYGLGVYDNFYGHKLVNHSGSVGVATAYMGFIPDQEVGIAVLANGSGYSPSQMGMYGLALLLGEDPEKIPFVQRDRSLSELEGVYETYQGTMKIQVRKMGEYLNVELHDKLGSTSTPIFPETLDGATMNFYSVANGYRLPVEFRKEPNGIGLVYERYYLRKSGKLV